LRRAFSANEDKDEDDFEDDDDDFCRTMENFFCCDFDFSKRFEEEEEKEDEEHAIIETEAAVEAMMTKTTMRWVRSTVGDDVLVCGDDFKYLQTRGPREREKCPERAAQKWREKFFLICMRFSAGRKMVVPHQSQSRRFSCFFCLSGWTVDWFTLFADSRKQINW